MIFYALFSGNQNDVKMKQVVQHSQSSTSVSCKEGLNTEVALECLLVCFMMFVENQCLVYEVFFSSARTYSSLFCVQWLPIDLYLLQKRCKKNMSTFHDDAHKSVRAITITITFNIMIIYH